MTENDLSEKWIYSGRRTERGAEVVRYRNGGNPERGIPLDPRLDLQRHSPSGLEWGYLGSGPAQLALALLADVLLSNREAIELHQRFKNEVVVYLDRDGWTLTEDQILAAVETIKNDSTHAILEE